MTDSLSLQLKTLPEDPGVYQFFDESKDILYVGKAKNLKKRVNSYFNKIHTNNRLRILVKKITYIDSIVVQSETDALLLENNLIKKHQPRYNILLKDDKTYPWICIKNERFPRVFYTRKVIDDGSEYYGPYTSKYTIRVLLDLIKNLYPLRTCNYDLSKSKIEAQKYKVCLDYHLGKCMAPCVDKMNEDDYNQNIQGIRSILKGNFKHCLQNFRTDMEEFSKNMEFEKAQKIKEKIESLENYQSKSTIVNPKINNVDVFSIYSDESYAYVNILQIAYGAIFKSKTLEIKKKLNEEDESILSLFIIEMRERMKSTSPEIYLPFYIDLGEQIKVTVPKLGDKKKLIDLSLKNTLALKAEKYKQIKITNPDQYKERILNEMKKDLRLNQLPTHIECFDNSNIQGTNPVAACVVFKNTVPSKKEYRHYNIKSVVGPDDYASMEEVIFRRYDRLLKEKQSLPQLIIIDGGKGQLSSAIKSLEKLNLKGKIAILGIAKKLEKLYFPNDSIPLFLDKRSSTLKVIQKLRNEAHRFGITFHRNKRSHSAIISELDLIKGIGEKTKYDLLKHFKSVKNIKSQDELSLANIIGKSRGKLIFDYFQEQKVK